MTSDIETKACKDVLNALDAQVSYYEAAVRKLGKKKADADYQRALLKAYICARDAVARRTARMMLGQAESE